MIGGQNPNLPVRYGASYKSNTALAANTPETIFTPAANVNGAIVWLASFWSYGVNTTAPALIAKTSAPTSAIDGDVVLSTDLHSFISGNHGHCAKLGRPVFIPAGKGLYFIPTTLEGSALRSALYTLL